MRCSPKLGCTASLQHSQPRNRPFTTNGQQGTTGSTDMPRNGRGVPTTRVRGCAECVLSVPVTVTQGGHNALIGRPAACCTQLQIAARTTPVSICGTEYANVNLSRRWLTTVPKAKPREMHITHRLALQDNLSPGSVVEDVKDSDSLKVLSIYRLSRLPPIRINNCNSLTVANLGSKLD
jgi:hypothetical protein